MDGEIFDMKGLEEQMNRLVDRGCLEETLKLQLSEFEMLESMYPNSGELCLDDPFLPEHFRNYVSGRTSLIPSRLDFTLNLDVDSHKLMLCVSLPSEYPNIEPDIFVRSNDLNRIQQGSINSDLGNYISGLDRGDICIGSAIAWLQENAACYFDKPQVPNEVDQVHDNPNVFSRLWIYSHHIYNKFKRREILDMAHEYTLTGFCLPGKPGVICIEGLSSNCEEWWLRVKNMNWKKITCKVREDTQMEKMTENEFRRFSDFKEISFENKANKKDCHMDFGEFYKYLKDHKCEYIFKEYFGFEGK
ncbi:UNVERIFIED_CONTAM: hypothetical protein PYX00_006038 [Menopon gallinae]|uniref:RWD domain-containing protein n=1 Tax=Menopon gallinae TaxID=328185 RepID=A0AAW2HVK5_9NEOP